MTTAYKVDARLAKTIEKILLEPRPTFGSAAEFSLYLAAKVEPTIEAREEVAYRMGVAEAKVLINS